jgi:hypothetical protein
LIGALRRFRIDFVQTEDAVQKLDPLTLTSILDEMVLKPFTGLKSAARDHNIAASTAFRWQAESARHEKEQRTNSEYLIEWMGNRSWYHRHVALARRLSILRLDQRLREDAVVPRREYLFRQGGEPIWQVDPQLAADALDPSTWKRRHGDRDIRDVYKRGPAGELLQAYKDLPPNPQLLIKAVSALLPEVYGETIKHQVMVGCVLRVGTTAPAAPSQQIEDADFTLIGEAPDDAPPPINVLAVADRPPSVAAYEQQFGGKRLVEATLFHDADGKLLPPLPGIVIVEGSPVDKAYSDAGIEHPVTSPQSLIAKGYCNSFLLRLATPADSDRVRDLQARLAAGVKPPPSGGQVLQPGTNQPKSPRSAAAATAPPGRASARYDAEGLGRGPDPRVLHGGGFKVRR